MYMYVCFSVSLCIYTLKNRKKDFFSFHIACAIVVVWLSLYLAGPKAG